MNRPSTIRRHWFRWFWAAWETPFDMACGVTWTKRAARRAVASTEARWSPW